MHQLDKLLQTLLNNGASIDLAEEKSTTIKRMHACISEMLILITISPHKEKKSSHPSQRGNIIATEFMTTSEFISMDYRNASWLSTTPPKPSILIHSKPI
jgi:hypothetical protein